MGGFIGSSLFAALTKYNWAPGVVSALIVAAVYVVAIGGLSGLGWTLGKRFYRAYPQSRGRTWGEDNDADEQVDHAHQGTQGDQGEQRAQSVQDNALVHAESGEDGAEDGGVDAGATDGIRGGEGREIPASARASAAESLLDDMEERAERDGKR